MIKEYKLHTWLRNKKKLLCSKFVKDSEPTFVLNIYKYLGLFNFSLFLADFIYYKEKMLELFLWRVPYIHKDGTFTNILFYELQILLLHIQIILYYCYVVYYKTSLKGSFYSNMYNQEL